MPRDDAGDLRAGERLAKAEDRAREIYRGMAQGRICGEQPHVQAALDYLLHSAPLIEEAYLRAREASRRAKLAWAEALRLAPADLCRNREEREAWAEASRSYQAALADEIAADAVMKGHYARRETARITIEAWQTASANVRANRL